MKPDPAIPDTHELLEHFAKRHHLELTDILEHEHVAVRAAVSANLLITGGYAGLGDTALSGLRCRG